MRSLLRYLINHYAVFLFLILEVLSFVLVINFNNYQKVQYLNSSNRIVASVYHSFSSVVRYFELNRVNEELSLENSLLRTYLQGQNNIRKTLPEINFPDSGQVHTSYIAARIINNSVNRTNNYVTLDKGRKHGLEPDQGIVSSRGIVGVVTSVSDYYSVGFSVLNKRWGPSGKLKKSGFFGPIEWDGEDYQIAELKEIPFHVQLEKGDTVVTSGYSSFFPEGLMIGTVQSFLQPEGESFYRIRIKLAVDFKSIHYVHVIDNADRNEIKELEKSVEDGETID